jgi:hypothetical protein
MIKLRFIHKIFKIGIRSKVYHDTIVSYKLWSAKLVILIFFKIKLLF